MCKRTYTTGTGEPLTTTYDWDALVPASHPLCHAAEIHAAGQSLADVLDQLMGNGETSGCPVYEIHAAVAAWRTASAAYRCGRAGQEAA